MLTGNESYVSLDQWKIRVRPPVGDGPHPVLLMLHGWTGDENVMWVFTPKIPYNYLLLAPRGLYPVPEGGFGWHAHLHGVWPGVNDFRPSVEDLLKLVDQLKELPEQPWSGGVDYSQVNLLGFSQGAALAYTFALLHPERVVKVAGLAGFLPNDTGPIIALRPLEGKQVFIAHGAKDETVPVDRARRAAEALELAGAQVTYCEDEVGHKLSANCFNGLESFFQ